MKQSDDLFVITYYDLKRIFVRHLTAIKWSVGLCGGAVLCLLLLQEPQYLAKASFKQASKQNELSFGNMKELFQQFVSLPSENAPIAIMGSQGIMKSAVEELGLQVKCYTDPFLVRVGKRAFRNAARELGITLEDGSPFMFGKVVYSGEKPLNLFLKCPETDKLQLFDSGKKLIAEGRIGQPLAAQNLQMIVQSAPLSIEKNQFYSLTVYPWVDVVEKVKDHLNFSPAKQDKTIIDLSFKHANRSIAAAFLNQIMESYQSYFRDENEKLCKSQLAYLEKRREELTEYFDQALVEHASYLKNNLKDNGFMGFVQEVQTLSEPQNLYTSQLFEVDLELERLRLLDPSLSRSDDDKKDEKKKKNPMERDKKKSKKMAWDEPVSQEQKDLLSKMESCSFAQESIIKPLRDEISQVSAQEREARILLQSIEKGESLPDSPTLLKDPKSAISQLVKQISLQNPVDGKGETQPPLLKEQLAPQLKELIVQLQRKREILQEDLMLQREGAQTIPTLTIDKAKEQLAVYTQQRDQLQGEMQELLYLRDQILQPEFEMSSLGAVFNDGVTNDLVQKASAISLQLKDDSNRSLREQQRLQETLQTQKTFLSEHLFQTIELKKLRKKLCDDKIASLHKTTLSLLNSEKELLVKKLADLNDKMGDLPEKWRRESVLLMKKEIGALMLEGISQLAETKQLGRKIFQVGSKPLDNAIPPSRTKAPTIFLLSSLAAIIGGALVYFGFLCKTLVKGVPVSDENLKVSGFPIGGRLTKHCGGHFSRMNEKDLETLRRIAEFLGAQPKTDGAVQAVCIGGKYPDYSMSLAELLSIRGKKVLVVQYVYDKEARPDEVPGLWQYMNNEVDKLPVRHHLTYDILPGGGVNRHAADFVANPRFSAVLSRVKYDYDIILLYSCSEASKAEGFAMLKVADAVVISVQQEIKDELLVYCNWAQTKGSDCAKFVYIDEMA